jgi:type IV secretory pathway protease TraF
MMPKPMTNYLIIKEINMYKQLKAVTVAGAITLAFAGSAPVFAQSYLPSSSSEVGHYIINPAKTQAANEQLVRQHVVATAPTAPSYLPRTSSGIDG